MKLIAAVITYYPDIEDSIKNIRQYIDHIDTLLIWENTPQIDRNQYKILIPGYENKIIYQGTGKNEGIGYPLNRIVEYCKINGYTHLLTMDQDSYFVNFETYKEKIQKYNDIANVGIFTPNTNEIYKCDEDIKRVPEAITSGSVYKLDIFSQDLTFREDYFIDMVDNEFCYHAYRKNIHTVVFPACKLQQNYGNISKHFGIHCFNYSAFRIYHLLRNYIVTWKDYPDLIQGKCGFIPKVILNRVIKIILFEKNKKQKLLAVYWGINDGIFQRMHERNFS